MSSCCSVAWWTLPKLQKSLKQPVISLSLCLKNLFLFSKLSHQALENGVEWGTLIKRILTGKINLSHIKQMFPAVIDVQQLSGSVIENQLLSFCPYCSRSEFLTPVSMDASLGHLTLSFSEECTSPLVVVGCIVLYLSSSSHAGFLCFSSSRCMNSQGGWLCSVARPLCQLCSSQQNTVI